MDEVFIELAKHSFVLAVLIFVFVLLVLLLFKLAMMYLGKIKNDSISNVQCMKAEIDKDVSRVEHKLQMQINEINGVKDKLHALANTMQNNNHRIDETNNKITNMEHKIDLLLVKLGSDPIKMAQER